MAKSNRRRAQDQRSAAAVKVEQLRQAQQSAERRRRTLMISGIVVVVIGVVVAIAVIIASHQAKSVAAGSHGSGATSGYGLIVGQPSAPVTMITYEDFQCPHCAMLESSVGAAIDRLIADGKLRVEYRPVAFLSEYSTRALNAAVCVYRAGGGTAFKQLHDTLFATQPTEGSSGLSTAELVTDADHALGRSSPNVAACINGGVFDDWASSATNAFSKATSDYPSGASTPTVLLNGSVFSADDLTTYEENPAAFTAQVEKLASGG